MGTYLSKLRIFNTTTNTTSADVAFGNTLYGICGTSTDTQNKTVVLSAFDTVENGISIRIKFTNGNSASNITLKIGNDIVRPVSGDCICEPNDIIEFTWDLDSWYVTSGGINKATRNLINNIMGNISANNIVVKSLEELRNNPQYIAPENTIIIIPDKASYRQNDGTDVVVPGIKISNGVGYAIDLPYIGDDIVQMVITMLNEHINNTEVHVSAEDRVFWNNKLNYSIVNENLNFNTL